jgi:hypothetical protein
MERQRNPGPAFPHDAAPHAGSGRSLLAGRASPTKTRSKALRKVAPSKRTRRKSTAAGPARMKPAAKKPSCDKVRAHRKRMKEKGMRLFQMWLPDTSTPEYAEQAHRASLAIANSPTEDEDRAFIDSVQWWASAENTE